MAVSLPDAGTLPGSGHYLADRSRRTRGGRRRRETRRSLQEAREKTARSRVLLKFLKLRTVSHKMIHGTAQETSASRASKNGSKEKFVRVRGRTGGHQRVDRRRRGGQITRWAKNDLWAMKETCMITETMKKVFWIKVKGKWSAKGKTTNFKIHT
jgi:hypothetical protein